MAISLGEAIITVSSSDGLIKKECKINVKNYRFSVSHCLNDS